MSLFVRDLSRIVESDLESRLQILFHCRYHVQRDAGQLIVQGSLGVTDLFAELRIVTFRNPWAK